MANAELIDVRYTGNSDPRSLTGAITLDDRDDIPLGGVGKVTKEEFARLNERGLVLEVMTAKDLRQPLTHSHGTDTHEHRMDFDAQSSEDLQSLADLHGMTVSGTGRGGSTTKKDLEDALTSAHA
jgi:hypothetical protein